MTESKAAPPAMSRASRSGNREVASHEATAPPTPKVINIAASQTPGRAPRRTRRVAANDPMAIPLTNDATIVENAYVVGPMSRAITRVHATSCTSAINPDNPAPIAADRASAIVDRPSSIVDRPAAIVDRPASIVGDRRPSFFRGEFFIADLRCGGVVRRTSLDD